MLTEASPFWSHKSNHFLGDIKGDSKKVLGAREMQDGSVAVVECPPFPQGRATDKNTMHLLSPQGRATEKNTMHLLSPFCASKARSGYEYHSHTSQATLPMGKGNQWGHLLGRFPRFDHVHLPV